MPRARRDRPDIRPAGPVRVCKDPGHKRCARARRRSVPAFWRRDFDWRGRQRLVSAGVFRISCPPAAPPTAPESFSRVSFPRITDWMSRSACSHLAPEERNQGFRRQKLSLVARRSVTPKVARAPIPDLSILYGREDQKIILSQLFVRRKSAIFRESRAVLPPPACWRSSLRPSTWRCRKPEAPR
jgi:hypothetical protein